MRSPHTAHPFAIAATSPTARSTRSEPGWAQLRDPEAARQALADVLAAGPEAAEAFVARGAEIAYDARTREDWELNTLFMDHDDYVFHPGDPMHGGPGFSSEYLGVEGYIEAMTQFGESWSNLKVEAGPVKVLDRSKALSVMLWTAEGVRSGMRMDWTAIAQFEFRDGLLIDQTFWWDVGDARRDVGRAFPTDW